MRSPRQLVHHIFSREDGLADHLVGRWLFLRALGLIYFSAFFALLFQILGLVGTNGILPANLYLERLQAAGAVRFWYAPTIFWLFASNHALMAMMWIGLLGSILIVLNIAPRAALIMCFLAYLSFIAVSQDFGQYQSDGMLLEAGFLALFLAPAGLRPRLGRASLPSRAAHTLLLWEWFRIYFESGLVKLQSGDPTWRNLTAMYEYYQNGPLPTWIGWYLEQLPHAFQKFTAGLTLVMELILIFAVFLPRTASQRRRGVIHSVRLGVFVLVTLWQIAVIATANYAFLNYLVLILAFLLLDDETYARFIPARFRFQPASPASPARDGGVRKHLHAIQTAVATVCLTLIAYVTTAELVQMIAPAFPILQSPILALEPFRIANSYGLFANMTPHRYEIEFQGSNDGTHWTPYPFRYKPQNPADRPRIYAPYQPRFDWNLWFASLGPWQDSPIVPLTEQRLLEGDREVLGLFASDPFRQAPPKQVRACCISIGSALRRKSAPGTSGGRGGTWAPMLQRLRTCPMDAMQLPQRLTSMARPRRSCFSSFFPLPCTLVP